MILRPATEHDVYALWLWRNDEATRKACVSPEPVTWDEHLAWFYGLSDTTEIVIGVVDWQPVGQVRADYGGSAANSTELSWTVAPESRGQGHGAALVAMAAYFARVLRPSCTLFARIKPWNKASRRIAERAGLEIYEVAP